MNGFWIGVSRFSEAKTKITDLITVVILRACKQLN